MIDNWLYSHRILHAYDYRIQLNRNAMYCDFYVPHKDIYIEFWGLMNDVDYRMRRKQKEQFYRDFNLKLINLTDYEMTIYSDYLKQEFNRFGYTIR